MDTANEITVKVNMDFLSLIELLLSNGFTLSKKFMLDDIYYVKDDTDLSKDVLDIIKDTVLLRTHTDKDEEKIFLTAKRKKFNKSGDIISQLKVDLEILSPEDAIAFLQVLSYKKLICIHADVELYSKGDLGICIQWVNRNHLLVEIEEKGKLNSTEKIIKALDETGIEYDKSNYFVKKAQLIFEENYR